MIKITVEYCIVYSPPESVISSFLPIIYWTSVSLPIPLFTQHSCKLTMLTCQNILFQNLGIYFKNEPTPDCHFQKSPYLAYAHVSCMQETRGCAAY